MVGRVLTNRIVLGLCVALALISLSASAQTIDAGRGPVAVHVPPSYDPGSPTPLIMALHRYNSDAAGIESYLQLTALSDEFGFLYLHPDGRTNAFGDRFWSATDACCNRLNEPDTDVAYLLDLINEMKSQYNVDSDRVHLVGHSNGGFMSHRMACEHPGTIASIASFAGATFIDPLDCQPTSPIHILEIHGTNDNDVAYAGGSLFGNVHPGAVATAEQWATKNSCDLIADTSAPNIDLVSNLSGAESTVTRYFSSCDPGGSVELWTIVNGNHEPNISATFSRQVVEYLFAHPRGAIAPGSLADAWVDFAWTGSTDGSESNPFATVDEALTAVASSGTVSIKGDTGDNSSPETVTIDREVTLQAVSGAVRIGDPAGRSAVQGGRSGFRSHP